MTIPYADDLHLPILIFLKDEKTHSIKETMSYLSEKFELTEEERSHKVKTGKRTFDTRVSWAVSNLRHANLLQTIRLGVFKITMQGKHVLEKEKKIDHHFLMTIKEYRDWIKNPEKVNKIKRRIQKKEKALPEKKGVILFLDLLGTKGIWKRMKKKDIVENWSKLKLELKSNFIKVMEDLTSPNVSSFSDTIIITLEFANDDDRNEILKRLGRAIWSSIVLSMNLDRPIRGCFSVGDFHHEETSFFGQAVDDAAEYNELPQWIGISAAPSGNEIIEQIFRNDQYTINQYYRKQILPLKNMIEQDAWVVDWPKIMKLEGEDPNLQLKEVCELMDRKLSEGFDVGISLKWRNTRKIFNDFKKDEIQ